MYNACIVLTDEHIHVGYYALATCVSYDIPTKNQSVSVLPIRESVDSLSRDDADMPMPPYIRKAYNRPNAAFVSLFR